MIRVLRSGLKKQMKSFQNFERLESIGRNDASDSESWHIFRSSKCFRDLQDLYSFASLRPQDCSKLSAKFLLERTKLNFQNCVLFADSCHVLQFINDILSEVHDK